MHEYMILVHLKEAMTNHLSKEHRVGIADLNEASVFQITICQCKALIKGNMHTKIDAASIERASLCGPASSSF
jgi:hypothetical protein